MRRALLTLVPQEPATFSLRAATEGAHRTLLAPPGSSLLGWAARNMYGSASDSTRSTIFHSGRVRFSNALPLTPQGHPAYPFPRLLMEPKHKKGGITDAGASEDREYGKSKTKLLDPEVATVGRPNQEGADAVQYDAIAKDGVFLAVDGTVVRPESGWRLRTAIENGRAKTGGLFGYAHVEPNASLRYAATIEADEGVLTEAEWTELLGAFRGRDLRLGRAANTGYGGFYRCAVADGGGAALWPEAASKSTSRLSVWAVSDLALYGANGEPLLDPRRSEELGLPAGGRLNEARSAIAHRRYAPWNMYLNRRDIERQVIEAGSVMTFDYAEPLSGTVPLIVGAFREAGLGRILVGSKLLEGEHPELASQLPAPLHTAAEPAAPLSTPEPALVRWARDRLSRATEAGA